MNFHALGILLVIAAPPGALGSSECRPRNGCENQGYAVYERGLQKGQDDAILILHNEIRAKLAIGEEVGSGGKLIDPATNVNDLTWSADLAQLAQKELDDCIDEEVVARDNKTARLYCSTTRRDGDGDSCFDSTDDIIRRWWKEAENFDKSMIESFPGDGNVWNYGQLIWAKTKEVGCGLVVLRANGENVQRFACKYSPGRVVGDQVYEKGCFDEDVCCHAKYSITLKSLTEAQKTTILEQHNQIRMSVKRGDELGSQCQLLPPASSIKDLEWSDEFQLQVQENLDSCSFDLLGEKANTNRLTRTSSQAELSTFESMADNVREWIYDSREFNPWTVGSLPDISKANSFALMISASTTKIGCGFTIFEKKGGEIPEFVQEFACKYSPGLVTGEQLYQSCMRKDKCCQLGYSVFKKELRVDEYITTLPNGEKVSGSCPASSCCIQGFRVDIGDAKFESQTSAILDLHNKIRSSVASGEEKGARGYLLSPGANLDSLVWSNKLARSIQKELDDNCVSEQSTVNGKNVNYRIRKVKKEDVSSLESVVDIIRAWRSEASRFNGFMVDHFPANSKATNFAQMISGGLKEVGCGLVVHETSNGDYIQKFACKYDSAPVVGQKVYEWECRVGFQCCIKGYPIWERKLTKVQKETIVRLHNEIRRTAAEGRATGSDGLPLPFASDIKDLEWSDEVEKVTQKRLDDCSSKEVNIGCATAAKLVSATSGNRLSFESVEDIMQKWKDEVNDFDKSMVDSLPDDAEAKRYAQLIWAKAKTFGCGYIVNKQKSAKNKYLQKLVCHYDQGPVVGEKVYNQCPPEDKCCISGQPIFNKGLQEEQKKAILDWHNGIRRSVAKGERKGKDEQPLPEASNMNRLIWSDELAELAEGVIDSCNADGLQRDDVGEVIHSMQEPITPSAIKNIIQRWNDQAELLSADVDSFPADSEAKFIAQVIWAETKEVGCGFSTSKVEQTDGTIELKENVVCYYKPRGAVAGMPVYLKGRRGSDCALVPGVDKGLCKLC